MIWAAYWAPCIAEKLDLIQSWASGNVRSALQMANCARAFVPMMEREQSLAAQRVAYELATLF